MRSFFDAVKDDGRPWLICGKGPSLSKLSGLKLSQYRIMTLNQAVCPVVKAGARPEVAHFIDIETLDYAPMEYAICNAQFICCPIYPHVKWRPTEKTQWDFAEERVPLAAFSRLNRLLFYNLCTKPVATFNGDFAPKQIIAKHCVSEASFHLLAEAGVKRIFTIGIDGGKGHSGLLSDLKNDNPGTYDLQFENISRICSSFKIIWEKL